MSRGLGKLQRLIKALIEAQGERFDRECDADPEGELPRCAFWLTWTGIRMHLFDITGLDYSNPDDKLPQALERAAKRALYTLHKRGEIGRIRHGERYLYMSAESYNRSFSPEAMASLKASFKALADSDG